MIAIESFIIGFFNAKGFALLTFLLKTFAVQNNVIYYAMWTPCALIFYHSLMIYCMTRSQIRLQFIKNIEYFSKIFALLLIFFAIKIFTQIHINI